MWNQGLFWKTDYDQYLNEHDYSDGGGSKFKTNVKRIVNVLKFSTFKVAGNNKVNPEEETQTEPKEDADEEIEVLISSHLEHFM